MPYSCSFRIGPTGGGRFARSTLGSADSWASVFQDFGTQCDSVQLPETVSSILLVFEIRDGPDRFEFFVRSRSHSKARSENMSCVQRQVQFPSGCPGMFIRASVPRFSKSCNGAIAT